MWTALTTIALFSIPLMGTALAEPVTAEAAKAAADQAASQADTAFMLISAALVLLMTPGLAFFYGGFVRSRNVLNTMMMSFILMGIVGTSWILWGYSLSFAPGTPFIGGLQWLFLNGVGLETTGYLAGSQPDAVVSYAGTIPHQTFMIYQAMFAIITPALISGAIVERISFKAYFWFIVLWSGILYPIFAHMVWAKGGFLGLYGGLGALDFAGGTVVHISSGVSALVAAWVLGPRKTYPNQPAAPHNVPYILLGAGLLWFGWFGFNGGSALASGSLATVAFVATTTSASAAGLVWVILEWILRGKPTAVGIATGAVAGLVGITPAAGFVTPIAALLIGAITATACFFAVSLKAKLQFDDSLDTFPVHGVGGTIGAILTGIFATKAVNSAGADGLLAGNATQVLTQIEAVAITYVLAALGTIVILKVLSAVFGGLRVHPDAEFQGVDIHEHGEEGYGEEVTAGFMMTRVE
ncbi:ammonium transporter [Leptolyngbya boryana NIES-2135]|uniref:Ammonium transporter n=2 Tax=Leptolyngbya group TaxID=3081713 RepID=A0A1Z4JFM9_LEPBY|nr:MULTISPECIES: ammonium transporter [Leptolyngbya]BAS58220.1 ammonium transporter [Leptolyngbya boryana IAM M-101]BAS64568.1 ammonium transporter [Leptolyngbya boryana dg5]BAY55569.1 ammonium transporter [Leptolyngbya boryana NIES-2135]MBD1854570.1 ammonium transporter [Leptolyngbya sp. FACHB-1624]MBD2369929.1 ammonium transporter [Leptolyngbya sp. FACHB-161]